MAQLIPLIILAALLVGMVAFTKRNKQRTAAAADARREKITAGTEVLTTSGLYGTVVSVNDDDTVLLSIAAGVEVKWTMAALREATELPAAYRGGLEAPVTEPNAQPGRAQPGSPETQFGSA